MKRLLLSLVLVLLAAVVSACSVGQVDSFEDVGPLGADVGGRVASSDPGSLELMLIAKAGGTPTPDDNDIVSATDQNVWTHAASGCLSISPTPRNPSVYVTNLDQSVSQYEVGAGGLLAPLTPAAVAGGDAPFAVAVSPDGGSVYVANQNADNVSQYDVGADGALTPKTPATVAAGNGANGVAVSPDGGSVYVTNRFDGNVSQYDVGAGGALTPKTPATVATGGGPNGVAVSPDGDSVYVANLFDGNVSQYDVGAGGALTPKTPATVATGHGRIRGGGQPRRRLGLRHQLLRQPASPSTTSAPAGR